MMYKKGEVKMARKQLLIVPVPEQIINYEGAFTFSNDAYIYIEEKDKEELFKTSKALKKAIYEYTSICVDILTGSDNYLECGVSIIRDKDLLNEEYKLEINEGGIIIYYGSIAGAFYGTITLKQIINQCKRYIPCMTIMDKPDFKVRGIMLDISRNKIPKMKTLFKLIDVFADLKINQIQLYIEGFSFAYQSMPDLWKHENPITGEEILEINAYCKDRFIELVPNQNSFGHMESWLEKDRFKQLAESPEGCLDAYGYNTKSGTLNPEDPKSIELVDKIYGDLIPYYTSNLLNVGCDEPFELGRGKSKELSDKIGVGNIYLNYIMKIYGLTKKYNKKMMMWGDIITQHPELIPKLPKDMIALEWGYEKNHPFEENCRNYFENKVPFYVCPGTSSWNSISGRTDNMKGSLLNAAINGKKYKAEGFLITDWGDNGHWQYLPFSYPGFIYGAALSWNVEKNMDVNIAAYIDKFITLDNNNISGKFIMDLGNYYNIEKDYLSNRTNIFSILFSNNDDYKWVDKIEIETLYEIKKYVDKLMNSVKFSDIKSKDSQLLYKELKSAAQLIKISADIGIVKKHIKGKAEKDIYNDIIISTIDQMRVLIKDYKEIWLERNRLGGLEKSIYRLENTLRYYEALLIKNE